VRLFVARDGVVPICGDARGQGVYILAPLGKLLSELLEVPLGLLKLDIERVEC